MFARALIEGGPDPVAKPRRKPHGRRVRCPGGYRAYVPDPLPPPIEWRAELVGVLSAADRAVGQLAGEGRRLSNPHLLIRPFVRREAVLSSRIEGTQATLGELLAAEAGAVVERSLGPRLRSRTELGEAAGGGRCRASRCHGEVTAGCRNMRASSGAADYRGRRRKRQFTTVEICTGNVRINLPNLNPRSPHWG